MSEYDAKRVLGTVGVPVNATLLARSAEEAVAHAQTLGFPVVLKAHSPGLSHKSDVHGVRLSLSNAEQVNEAFASIQTALANSPFSTPLEGVTVQRMIDADLELFVGATRDPQAGPVIVFGSGGTLVEVTQDFAAAVAPFSLAEAERTVHRTKISRALTGFRGRPTVDIAQLCKMLMAVGDLMLAHGLIEQIDVNPLLVMGTELIAVDARIVLNKNERPDLSGR